jgi:hypothetical protein
MSRHAECYGRKLLVLIVVLATMLSSLRPAVADDVLTPADKTTLTYHLNTIANDPGWPQASVDAANNILAASRYTSAAWDDFFTVYFATHPFTSYLNNYLGYPMYYWFSDSVHQNLQKGITASLVANMKTSWSMATAAGGTGFSSDAVLTQTLLNSQSNLIRIGKDCADAATRQGAYNGLLTVFAASSLLKVNAPLPPADMPYFATFRVLAQQALVATAPSALYNEAIFSPTIKAQVTTALGLHGDYARLWNEHTVLLGDNYMSTARQRQTILNFLDLLPAQLHNTVSISMNDNLGNNATYQSGSYNTTSRYGGVNIFSFDIGAYSENSFPSDVPAGSADVFTLVLEHELTHVVDSYTIANSATLSARRQALLAAAGTDSQNYLRSMFAGDFFQQAPQEFIASIGNEWFADSAKTVQLGLVRFDAGRHEPLNQALFFAEILSQGGNTTLFYTTDTNGQIVRQDVSLGRDANGFIDELTMGGKQYSFTLDASGNVTGYSVPEPASLCILALGTLAMRRRRHPIAACTHT